MGLANLLKDVGGALFGQTNLETQEKSAKKKEQVVRKKT